MAQDEQVQRNFQTHLNLKSDPNLFIGEGSDAEEEIAKEIAKVNLIQNNIGSLVVIQTERQQNEILSTDSSSFYQEDYSRKIKSVTSIYLKGIKFETYQLDSQYYAMAFIPRDSVIASMKYTKSRIRQYINLGINEADEGNLGECLKYLYWGYLLSSTFRDTIQFQFGNQHYIYPQDAIPNILRKIVDKLEIINDTCYFNPDDSASSESNKFLSFTSQFKYQTKPVNGLKFEYFALKGKPQPATTDNGKVKLYLFDWPDSSPHKLALNIQYDYQKDAKVVPEIEEIRKLFGDNYLSNIIKETLVFIVPIQQKSSLVSVLDKEDISKLDKPENRKNLEQKEINEKLFEVKRQETLEEALSELTHEENPDNFKILLKKYQSENIIRCGNQRAFISLRDGYIAILSPDKLLDFAIYNGHEFISIKTKERYKDLIGHYKRRYLIEDIIWIKALDNERK